MSLGKQAIPFLFLLAAAPVFTGCSGGSSSSAPNQIMGVVQDLELDADGLTTVVTFTGTGGMPTLTSASFEADGGQTALSVEVDGDTATVTWDARVTPSHQVRVTGLARFTDDYAAVTTSDDSAPSFEIVSGTQTEGLGGDEIVVTFSGPRVAPETASDLGNWTLRIGSTALDLSGSSIGFDAETQTLTMVTGELANLHASFTLAAAGLTSVADVAVSSSAVSGAASGDDSAPSLVSAVQNLDQDEFGRVIDFTFDEAMDPVFSTLLSRFSVTLPDIATSVTQVTPEMLRVSFNNPIVPDFDTVMLINMVDAHGNALDETEAAIEQGSSVANDFDGTPDAQTVENTGGDRILVLTTQAFDPDSAQDPASWLLDVGGEAVDMEAQTLTYDLTSKTLMIELAFDMRNGDSFELTGLGVLDVDGDGFMETVIGTVSGDEALPTVVSVTQNRSTDESGMTVDVAFSEDLDTTAAETLGNYTFSGALDALSATLLPNGKVVRLVCDGPVVPNDYTLNVSAVEDLAGNAMDPDLALSVVSTDTTAPAPTSATASALTGANNDMLTVVLDDLMVEAEITDPANWTVESPTGTTVDTAGASVSWDGSSRTAMLVFENGFNLLRGDDFSVTFATARDIGGNAVATTVLSGDVAAESTLPTVCAVHRVDGQPGQLVVRFSEPCGPLTDLWDEITNPAGMRYVLRSAGGIQRGTPVTATALDEGLGVRLSFGVVVGADDTLDVIGVTDLAGNPLFPVLALANEPQDANQPDLGLGLSAVTSVSGENNDSITVVFDRPMSPWMLLDPSNYAVQGSTAVDLAGATLSFDGVDTLTIGLQNATGHNLQTGDDYSIAINNVWSRHGVQRTVENSEAGIVAEGDALAPSVGVSSVRLDPSDASSLLVTVDETVDALFSSGANYDYDGGNLSVSAERLGACVIRATFAVTPVAGATIDLTVGDLAGNVSGLITRAVTAADVSSPLVLSVSGTIAPGRGGDIVEVAFNEPVTTATALDVGNYVVRSNGQVVSLAGSSLRYVGNTNMVRILLAPGCELSAVGSVQVTLGGVADFSGNAMPATITVGGAVSGDDTAPSIAAAFVNWRQDASGSTVDVLFSEDVDTAYAGAAGNWSATGGVTVSAVEQLSGSHWRLTLSGALGASATLGISGLADMAGNAAGALSVDPLE